MRPALALVCLTLGALAAPPPAHAHVDAPTNSGGYQVRLERIEIVLNREGARNNAAYQRELELLEEYELFVSADVTAATHGTQRSAHGPYPMQVDRPESAAPKITIRPHRADLLRHADCTGPEDVSWSFDASLISTRREGKDLRKKLKDYLGRVPGPLPSNFPPGLDALLKPRAGAGLGLDARVAPAAQDPFAPNGLSEVIGHDRGPLIKGSGTKDVVVHYFVSFDYDEVAVPCAPGFPGFFPNDRNPDHPRHDTGPAEGAYRVELREVILQFNRVRTTARHRKANAREVELLEDSDLFIAALVKGDTHGEQESFHGMFPIAFKEKGATGPRARIATIDGRPLFSHTDCAGNEPVAAWLSGSMITGNPRFGKTLRRTAREILRTPGPGFGSSAAHDGQVEQVLNPQVPDGWKLAPSAAGLRVGVNDLVGHSNAKIAPGSSTLDVVVHYIVNFDYVTAPPSCLSGGTTGQPSPAPVLSSTPAMPGPTVTVSPGPTVSPSPGPTVSPSPTPPPAQCDDGVDNDGDGNTDFNTDPSCTDAGDDSENTAHACTLSGSNVSGDFKIQGSCTGPYRMLHFTPQGGVQFDGAFSVLHSEGSCSASTTLVSCNQMKLAMANPEHFVEAVFGTTSSTNQSMLLEFFDPTGVKVSEQVVFRGS